MLKPLLMTTRNLWSKTKTTLINSTKTTKLKSMIMLTLELLFLKQLESSTKLNLTTTMPVSVNTLSFNSRLLSSPSLKRSALPLKTWSPSTNSSLSQSYKLWCKLSLKLTNPPSKLLSTLLTIYKLTSIRPWTTSPQITLPPRIN